MTGRASTCARIWRGADQARNAAFRPVSSGSDPSRKAGPVVDGQAGGSMSHRDVRTSSSFPLPQETPAKRPGHPRLGWRCVSNPEHSPPSRLEAHTTPSAPLAPTPQRETATDLMDSGVQPPVWKERSLFKAAEAYLVAILFRAGICPRSNERPVPRKPALSGHSWPPQRRGTQPRPALHTRLQGSRVPEGGPPVERVPLGKRSVPPSVVLCQTVKRKSPKSPELTPETHVTLLATATQRS